MQYVTCHQSTNCCLAISRAIRTFRFASTSTHRAWKSFQWMIDTGNRSTSARWTTVGLFQPSSRRRAATAAASASRQMGNTDAIIVSTDTVARLEQDWLELRHFNRTRFRGFRLSRAPRTLLAIKIAARWLAKITDDLFVVGQAVAGTGVTKFSDCISAVIFDIIAS